MIVIKARNVQQALPEALYQLRNVGVERDSRNGPVVMFPEPVATVYLRPVERVMFWEQRDCNPFFHLYESLWMLSGRNDVEGVAHYVERMRSFSDDGVTLHGAYGYRWRNWFGFDQLQIIINALKADPNDRRQILSMWDAYADLGRKGKDLPCNLQAIFQIATDGRLDMTVTNRSNDIVWGAYGANAVHFSYLHEYMARHIGVEVGVYRQVSANFHAYKDTLAQVAELADKAKSPYTSVEHDPYTAQLVRPFPLMTIDPKDWDGELAMFMDEPTAIGFRDPFFKHVAVPMARAHAAYKRGGPDRFINTYFELGNVKAEDWRLASEEWVARRERKAAEKRAQDDGVSYE